jgi:hypothetical protein
VTAVAPPGIGGTKAKIKVTTGEGSAESLTEFEWEGVAPTTPVVSSINPTKGPAAGGTTVTITGEHLTGTTAVEFGTTAATSFDEVSGTEVTAVAPPGIGGTKAKIKVTTGEGSAESLTEFEWTAPAIVKHKLTINPAGDGSGRVTCNGGECATEYAEGTVVRLTATPNAGSDFSGWQGAGCSGTGVCTVTIGAADVAVTATFKKAPTDNPPDDNHPGDNPPSSNPPSKDAPPVGTKPPSGTPKTPAQKLKEKRQKAIAKCMKLKGKSRAKCMKRANQIGKPKKKAKKARAGEGNQVLGGWSFW